MNRQLLRNFVVMSPYFAYVAWFWITPKPIDLYVGLAGAVVSISASAAL